MKKILIAFTALLTGISTFAQAPQLPAKCEAFQPEILKKNLVLKEKDASALANSSDYGQKSAQKVKQYWTVYSDRDANTTYRDPACTQKYSTLSFNETVIIAKIQGKNALVYKDSKVGEEYPKISASAECMGWIPMSRLLLWQSCLSNDRGILNKALLCINLNEVGSNTSAVGTGYLNPETKSNPVKLSTDMNFYFIMKKEKGQALLATQYKMDGSFTDKVLYCWVPEESYVPWNQRSCAEPTWDHDDVEYFSSKNRNITIYKSRSVSGSAVSSIPFTYKATDKYDKYQYRMDPDHLRFPILDDGTKEIYSMSTFSTIGGKAYDPNKKTNVDKIDEAREKDLKNMQNINLAVVIDGTSSMGMYYPAVKEAIIEGCKYFSKSYKIKVGVVIYRDYADGDKGLVEVFPMADPRNNANLTSFLDKGGSYGIKSSSSDKTNTEALYYGINTALEKLSFKQGQSNIMLIVGDCGNAATDTKAPGKDELIKKIVDKDIHLMGFQVRNKQNADWNSFNNQLTEMMRTSLQKKYDKFGQGIKVSSKQFLNDSRQLNGYNFAGNNVDVNLYICNHRFADAGVNNGEMEVRGLEQYMEGAISSFAQTIQEQIDLIGGTNAKVIEELMNRQVSGFSGGAATSGPVKVSEAFLKEKFKGIDLSTAENTVVNFRGYTSKVDASGRAFFKPVLFISREEFQDLLKKLQKVNEVAQVKSNDREPYIEAMKALVKSLAPGMTDAEMAKLGNGEIMNMVAGLNEAAAALNSYTLTDLSNPQVINPQKYLKILTDFSRNYKNLQNIFSSNKYMFTKEFNGAKYYWIPIEELP